MDTLRQRIFWVFVATMVAACSSSVELGAPPDSGAPPIDDASLPDAPLADAAPDDATPIPSDDAAVPPVSSCPCGFCFEHRAHPGFTDLWVRSPTDIWLVAGGKRIERFDGVSYTDVPLPPLDSELQSILALDGGEDERPFLALSRARASRGRIHELYRHDGSGWEPIALPEALRVTLSGRLRIAPTRDGQLYASMWWDSDDTVPSSVFYFDGDEWTEHAFGSEWHVWAVAANAERAFVALTDADYVVALHENTGDGWHGFPAPSFDPSWGYQAPRIAMGERLYALSDYVHIWDPAASAWRFVDVPRAIAAGGHGSAQWIIGSDRAFLSTDPEDPTALSPHSLPFTAEAASFPADGPAWIAGDGLAYWNGARWTSVHSPSRLYSRIRGKNAAAVWGTSADDFWLVDRHTATHVHDHIAEKIHLDGRSSFTSTHGIDEDDVFFVSAHAVHRVIGLETVERHLVDTPFLSASTRLWGTDEEHLWLTTIEGVFRYQDGGFVPEPLPDATDWPGARTFIGGRSKDDVWAMSDSGAVYNHDGATWNAMPPVPLGYSYVLEAHVGETGVWLLAQRDDSLHVWSNRSGDWERTELAEPGDALTGDLFGRGDEVWVVTEDRVIFRRQDDDTWARDDSCREAGALTDITFTTGWFPPDGAPPKIFGSTGNVLVEQAPE